MTASRIRQAAAQKQRDEQLQSQRAAEQEKEEQTQKQKTTTGVYEKGGAVIQETRGDFETLKRLEKQQPGSAVVQDASGEYVLISSQGLNLQQQSTLETINRNIETEGGSGYTPTRIPKSGGGFLEIRQIKDSVSVSEPVPSEGGEITGTRFKGLVPGRPTKYKVVVGEGSVIAEQPSYAYTLNIGQPVTPRPTEDVEVFPITYYTDKGEELVIITGKSPGAEYSIYGPGKDYFIEFKEPEDQIGIPEILPGTAPLGPAGSGLLISTEKESGIIPKPYGPPTKPERQGPPRLTDFLIETGKQTLISEGARIAKESLQFGVPQQTKPIKAQLTKYEKPVPADILFQPERYGDIPSKLSKPGFIVSVAALAATYVYPTRVPRLQRFIPPSPFKGTQVRMLESQFLKEPRVISGAEKLTSKTYVIGKGTEEVRSIPVSPKLESKLQVTRKGSKVSAAYPKEPAKVIIPKPSQPAVIPLTVVEFGAKKPFVEEIRPIKEKSQIPSTVPQEVVIRGQLKPSTIKALGAKRIAPYTYTTQLETARAKTVYQKMVGGGKLVPIAKSTKAPIKDILRGKSEQLRPTYDIITTKKVKSPEGPVFGVGTRSTITKPITIYAMSKAERKFTSAGEAKKFRGYILPKGYGPRREPGDLLRVGKPMKPLDLSPDTSQKITPGGLARARALTETPSASLLKMVEAKAKPEVDILFAKPQSLGYRLTPIETLEQGITYPPGEKASVIQGPELKTGEKTLTAQVQEPSIKQTSLIGQKLEARSQTKQLLTPLTKEKLKERAITIQTPISKTKPSLALTPKLRTAQTPRLKQRQVFKQEIVPKIPVEKIPRLRPPKIPVFILPDVRKKTRKEPSEPKSAFDWKGNVPEFKIEGVYKKYDIIYGEKRIAKTLREERYGKRKRRVKKKTDILGFPKTKKAKSNVSLF